MKRSMELFLILCSLNLWVVHAEAQNFSGLNQNVAQSNTATSSGDENTSAQGPEAKANTPSSDGYSSPGRLVAGEQNSKYTLGPQDVITITVMRHPEVSGTYTLNSEGKIQYEFVGDVMLSGLTKEGAAVVLAKYLETYIINPEVSVKISEYNSKVVYVVGEVGNAGKIYMRGDTITVRDALLSAGLPQLTAATDKATLFTPSASGRVVLKKVNVYALLYRGDLRENYVMKPGDTLYLPPTLWAKIARFINPIAQPVGATAGTAATIAAF